MFSKLKYLDWPLFVAMSLLLTGGLAILYGTTVASSATEIFFRQLIFALVGLAGFLFLSLSDYHAIIKQNRIVYLILLGTLVYLLIFGSQIRGGRRWVDFGLGNFQPAEFIKLSVVLGLARLLHLRRGQINSWQVLLGSILYTALPAVLVLVQPDLGSALVISSLWAGLVLISPISKKNILIIFTAAVLLAGVTWQFGLKTFQKDRIKVFLDPGLDPKGKGYNVKQATIAVGSGGMAGRGLALGLQSQNRFLPERQTDFIFAAGSEQIGFLGCLGILCLFFFCAFRLLKIARLARDDAGMYLCSGIFFLLSVHAVVNIGMNIGLLPVTGIPLPFFSAGGSGLVVILLGFGLAQSVAVQSKGLRF